MTELAHQVAWLKTLYGQALSPSDISNQAHQAKALADEANLRVKALVDYPALSNDDLPADIAELEDTAATEVGEAQSSEEDDGLPESTSQTPAHHDNREQKNLDQPSPAPTLDSARKEKMASGGLSSSKLATARYIPNSELSNNRFGDLDHE